MKKILPLLLIIVLLPACGVSKEVRNVINSIDSLPEITLESGAVLDDIESAYNALSDEEKQQVDNLSVLEEAREHYKELERKQKNESILDSVYLSWERIAAQIAIQRMCTAAIKASEVLA